jgi:hypothetical protein
MYAALSCFQNQRQNRLPALSACTSKITLTGNVSTGYKTRLYLTQPLRRTVKHAVFWDVTPCGSCKNRRSVRRLLVTANVPSSPILVALMMEAIRSSETPVLTGATRRNIPEYTILHNHRQENLKSYKALTAWAL